MRVFRRFKARSLSFTLVATGIDQASEWLVENLVEAGVEKPDRIRTRLILEEALLNLADRFGETQEATAFLEKRYGRLRLRLTVKGEPFNPMKTSMESAQSEWSASLFSILGLHVQYNYAVDTNVLRVSLPQPAMNPVLKIVIAILGGALAGIICNVVVPDPLQESISGMVLEPIADMWVRLLQAISGPIIFLTALTATFDTKRIADYGGSRITTIVRYFGVSAVVVVFTMLCSVPLFTQDITFTETNGEVVSNALDVVLQVVPGNLVEPFSSANTPQLLLIAIVTGYLLATVESQVMELKVIIQQLNVLGLTVAQKACSFVPFFVGLLLCLKIWTHDYELLGEIWKPLVLSAALSAVVLAAGILATSAYLHANPITLARKLKGPFLEALKKGTLDFSAIGDLAESCNRHLGIDKEFAEATLPQGLILYMPTSAIGICVFVLFAAQTQELPIDQMWLLAVAALSVVLAVATPPLTGANLLSFIVAFTYLNIPNAAILDVMIFDLVFGVLCIAFDQAMLQLETIRQAKSMGFLDENTLRAPLASTK